ncbi:MAG: preprotein translocase subunit SecG [Candidatus Omnitrophica bacterium]|nr:preprotein translocase subunit SecG [Candidatus Omnitrophota bacterium]
MYGLLIFIHIVVCILLIMVILIQRGRGGGLIESFSGFESMFGPKTNVFLTRSTTILAIIFMCTCLILTFFSINQSRSLMEKQGAIKEQTLSQEIPQQQTGSNTSSDTQNIPKAE